MQAVHGDLDVLIAVAGRPPVEDIEGTPAPRRPLAPNVAKQNSETPVTPAPEKKKRGRPPKTLSETPTTSVALAAQASVLSSSSSDEDASQENAEVGAHIFFIFSFYVYIYVFTRFSIVIDMTCSVLFTVEKTYSR